MARVEGVEYTPEAVESLRQEILIPLRDTALETNNFTYAVGLSHILVYMAEYGEVLASGKA